MVEPSYSDSDSSRSSAYFFECISTRHSAIQHDDRIDQLATLHATLSAVVRQILAPLSNHESVAAWTMISVVNSCPTSIRHLNRLLWCHSQRRTHGCLLQQSNCLPHTIHKEMEWQLAFQKAPAQSESSMSLKIEEIEQSRSGISRAKRRSAENNLPIRRHDAEMSAQAKIPGGDS
jgi:hypothetical protein